MSSSCRAGRARRLRWGGRDGGRSLVVRAGRGLYEGVAPPDKADVRPVPANRRAAAESTLAVLLGRPAFARVVPCAEPGDLCVAGDTGAPGRLAAGARDAARWGDDSVAFFKGDEVEIRPLGGGARAGSPGTIRPAIRVRSRRSLEGDRAPRALGRAGARASARTSGREGERQPPVIPTLSEAKGRDLLGRGSSPLWAS